jgi:hypothetical protein
MIINPYRFSSGGGEITPDNQHMIVIFGESLAAGNSSPGTTLPNATTGAVFQYNNTSGLIEEVSGSHILGEVNGAPWISYANYVYAQTLLKTIIVNCAQGGSTAWPVASDPTNTWYTSATLYTTMVARAKAAMALKNLTKVKIYIELGVNDCQTSATTTANIVTGYQSLYDRLTVDFPGCDIVWAPVGYVDNTAFFTDPGNIGSAKQRVCRKTLKEFQRDYSNFFLGPTCANLCQNGYNQAANVHLNDSGNIIWGQGFGKWYVNSTLTKRARFIVSSLLGEITARQKGLIETLISSIADWDNWDIILPCFTSDQRDIFTDYAGIVAPVDRGLQSGSAIGWTKDKFISGDGVNKEIDSGYKSTITGAAVATAYSTQDNALFAVKLVTNRSTNVLFSLFGGGTASGSSIGTIFFRQKASGGGIEWRINTQTTNTYATEGDLKNDRIYGLKRTAAGASALIINLTEPQTVSTASTGSSDDSVDVCDRSVSGTPQAEYGNVDIGWVLAGPGTQNYASAFTAMETFRLAWPEKLNLKLNFGMNGAAPSVSGWNNIWGESNPDNAAGTIDCSRSNTGNNLWSQWCNINGTGVGVRSINTGNDTTSWARAAINSGQSTGNNSGVYPDLVLTSFWYVNGGQGKIEIYGLDNAKTYKITLMASRDSAVGGSRRSIFTVNGVALTALQSIGNTSTTVNRTGVSPSSGVITVLLDKDDNSLAYLNALVIEEE